MSGDDVPGLTDETVRWELQPITLPADPLIMSLVGSRVSVAYGDGAVLAGVLDSASHMFISIADCIDRAGPVLIQVGSIRTIALVRDGGAGG